MKGSLRLLLAIILLSVLSLSASCSLGDAARLLEGEGQGEEPEEPMGKGDVLLYRGRMTDEPNGSYRAYRVSYTVTGGERGEVPFRMTVWTEDGGKILDGATEDRKVWEYTPFLEVGQEISGEHRFWVREQLSPGEAVGSKTFVKFESLRPYDVLMPKGKVEVVVYRGRMTDEMFIDNTDEAYLAYYVSYTVMGIERGEVTLEIHVRTGDGGKVLRGDAITAEEHHQPDRYYRLDLFLERGEESTGEVLFWVHESLLAGEALGSKTSVEIKAITK